MKDNIFPDMPIQYESIASATTAFNFMMASDLHIGSLLKTLAASKPGGNFLELGTGTGLATSWIADGMDVKSRLITIDNNEILQHIAKNYLKDSRIEFMLADGYKWIVEYKGEPFDLIFADAMPGKYDLFDETIALLKIGGLYVIDDMMPQSNWTDGHADRVTEFITMLESREDVILTKIRWSTGIIMATKTKNLL